MNYTLYISENCDSCVRVLKLLENTQNGLKVVNLDQNKTAAPKNLLIIPALYSGENIMAYGNDIVDYLKKSA